MTARFEAGVSLAARSAQQAGEGLKGNNPNSTDLKKGTAEMQVHSEEQNRYRGEQDLI